MELEHSLLRVPYERLSNVFKNSTKMLEKELGQVVQEILQLKKTAATSQAAATPIKSKEASNLLGKLLARIESLKKKVIIQINLRREFLTGLQGRRSEQTRRTFYSTNEK